MPFSAASLTTTDRVRPGVFDALHSDHDQRIEASAHDYNGRWDESRVSGAVPGADLGSRRGIDVLGAVLRHLELRDLEVVQGTLSAGDHVQMPSGWVACYLLRRGSGRLRVRAENEVLVEADELVLLASGAEHRLQGAPPPAGPREVGNGQYVALPIEAAGRSAAKMNPCEILAIRFRHPGAQGNPLLGTLPAVVKVPSALDPARGLKESLVMLEREAGDPRPGGISIVEHLVQVVMLQALRFGALATAMTESTWMPLSDPDIAAALHLIHSRPSAPWTVASLAEAVGLSRSTFAARFAERVGATPLRYLWQERMDQAAKMLNHHGLGIKQIAARVGYDSESAFSNAFKRWSGYAPGCFRREQRLSCRTTNPE